MKTQITLAQLSKETQAAIKREISISALTDQSAAINKIMSELDEYLKKMLNDDITAYSRVGVRGIARAAREEVSAARRKIEKLLEKA